ncbi:isopentenyl-diphosphate delta-isomerase [Endozoicomonas numazuensis]|uniref:isopentenyl-diphosphate delta-isomerase n=1 Tax=Endozoicomonas numazuensis TaxID=1137799 RepID=UPI000B0A2FBD|nr:isopentenyl-diphosphate delta-isomerase [Endozoicomonas numazuensis]
MNEPLIVVNENDQVLGSASKLASHKAPGVLHRAFSVLLFNPSGQLLVQRRASSKITFPDCWANTCCSHPHYVSSELESRNELGVKRAALRKLNQELGIPVETLSEDDFLMMTKVRYRADSGSEWVEEELDYILVVRADVELAINTNEVSEVQWLNPEQLSEMLSRPDGKEPVSVAPWFRLISEHFLFGWWSVLDDPVALKKASDREIHRLKF